VTDDAGLVVPVLDAGGPVLLFGGCYSNLQATQALLEMATQLGIPGDRIVCTGDVVAYAGDPAATVELVRASGMHVVMGNCEESLGRNAADCGCGWRIVAAASLADRLAIFCPSRGMRMPTRCWTMRPAPGCVACRAVLISSLAAGTLRLSMAARGGSISSCLLRRRTRRFAISLRVQVATA
jgi:hypothetical protein